MSTKTTKRKRASAQPAEAVAPSGASVAAAPPSAPEAAAPEAKLATPTLALSSNCTVKDANGMKAAMLQLLEEPANVTIDARSVERIDTAIVQLLCAFVRDRAERNLAVSWHATPQPLLDAVRLLGVGSMLALPANG